MDLTPDQNAREKLRGGLALFRSLGVRHRELYPAMYEPSKHANRRPDGYREPLPVCACDGGDLALLLSEEQINEVGIW